MFGIQNPEAFLLASIVLNMIPGADTFYVLSRSMSQGQRIGIASVLGISAGILLHTLMAALGLSAIIASSATAFMLIKLLGAGYLIYLGIKLFCTDHSHLNPSVSLARAGFLQAFKQGLVTNALNPKIALFFLAFLPQFVAPDSPSTLLSLLALGIIFALTSTFWGLGLAWFAASISQRMRANPKYLNYLNKLAGTILVAIGIKLVLEND